MYPLELCSFPHQRRKEIIEQFWGASSIANVQHNPFEDDCYFEYFGSQCRLARQYDDPQNQVCTQRNICDIVFQLRNGEHRDKIIAELALKTNLTQEDDEKLLCNTIDLAVRLWLMVHIGNVQRGVTGQTALLWREGCLKDCISSHFQHQRVLTDTVKFEKAFNARNVERIADVVIRWTPNLVDHLRLIDDGKKPVLNIFHHASFLNYHRDGYGRQKNLSLDNAYALIVTSSLQVSSMRPFGPSPCSFQLMTDTQGNGFESSMRSSGLIQAQLDVASSSSRSARLIIFISGTIGWLF
jgi:hypothetical protein